MSDPIWIEIQKKSNREKILDKRELNILESHLSNHVYQNFKKYAEKNAFLWELNLFLEIGAFKNLYHYIMTNDKILFLTAKDIVDSYRTLRFANISKLVSTRESTYFIDGTKLDF
jgi:hypothetical protein